MAVAHVWGPLNLIALIEIGLEAGVKFRLLDSAVNELPKM
jgi:hypothetical protein